MTTIETAIMDYLLSIPAIADLIGDKLWFGQVAPEGSGNKYVLVHRISGGRMGDGLPFRRPRYQLTPFAPTYDEAREIADLVADALDNFKGVVGGFPMASSIANEMDLYDSETGLHYCPVDAMVLYQTHNIVAGVAAKIE